MPFVSDSSSSSSKAHNDSELFSSIRFSIIVLRGFIARYLDTVARIVAKLIPASYVFEGMRIVPSTRKTSITPVLIGTALAFL